MANSLIEMDNRLTDFEIAWDKASIICSDIEERYFGKTEPESWFLKTHYNSSEIKKQHNDNQRAWKQALFLYTLAGRKFTGGRFSA